MIAMVEEKKTEKSFFEQGPIRPPSEAWSLLLRVTRNCSWNRCLFCPVYKDAKFSLRPLEEVLADIEAMEEVCGEIKLYSMKLGYLGEMNSDVISRLFHDPRTPAAARALLLWLSGGGRTAFLQDADSLVVKPGDLAVILKKLRRTFPTLERVTGYSRSRTLCHRTAEDLEMLKEAGLDRVHVGLESGCDAVLSLVKKGATAEKQITGGRRVVEAGLELSEYVMPGLGGRDLSEEHARETARVLSAVDPHFIRLRTLAIPASSPLAELERSGRFVPLSEDETVREIRRMIEGLEGCTGRIVSDHMLNLLQDLEGKLPEDKERLLAKLDEYLDLPDEEREAFVVGRRAQLYSVLDDRRDGARRRRVEEVVERLRKRGDGDVSRAIREIMSRFI